MHVNGSVGANGTAEQVEQVIARHGWAVIASTVYSAPVAYTVGLTGAGRPELALAGAGVAEGRVILNTMANTAVTEGLRRGEMYQPLPGVQQPGRQVVYRPEAMPDDVAREACPIAYAMYGQRLRVWFLRRLVEDTNLPGGGLILPH